MYCLNGCIDYERHQSQHELGQIQEASVGESCTQITAAAGFVGGVVGAECPDQLDCPCLDLTYTPPGFCIDTTLEPPVVECALNPE